MRMRGVVLASTVFLSTAAMAAQSSTDALADLVKLTGEVEIETRSSEEYGETSKAYRKLSDRLAALDREDLTDDDAIDAQLLEAHLETRLFELEELRLHEVVPADYLALSKTSSLLLRPCSQPDKAVAGARDELLRREDARRDVADCVRR